MEDPYRDAPVDNPYDSKGGLSFGRGVSRHQNVIENTYDEARKRREDEERVLAQQKASSERISKERQADANSAFKEQAKEGGFDDFVYTDEEGTVKSALTPDQEQSLQRERSIKSQEEAEKEAMGFRAKDLDRQISGVKKTILTDSQRGKREEELAKKGQSLQM